MCTTARWILISTLLLSSFSGYAQTHIVAMKTNDMGIPVFEPNRLLIQPGDTVMWRNLDSNISHNIVADPNGIPEGANLFESPLLEKVNQEWSHWFSHAGTYHYHCHPHAEKGMIGTIVVGRESPQDEVREASGSVHIHHH